MKEKKEIPSVDLVQVHKKDFGFQIVSNREVLLEADLNHNPFRPHRIRFYAILFILEGEGLHTVDFKTYPYRKGSIIFISKEQVHAFEKSWERKAYFLLFTEEFLEKGSLGSNLMQQLSLYNYHLYSPVINLKKDQLAVFSTLVKRIKEEFDAPDDLLTEEIIHSSLKIFLCMAERIRKENRQLSPRSKYHDEFKRFQKLLAQHICESRQVKFYADQLLISTKKLNRITQEMLDQPAKNYINDFLIIEIKRLLMNTSLTVKEIAHRSGFEETTNFVKYFKKYTGFKPSAFRDSYSLV